jgi:hypothetical protein
MTHSISRQEGLAGRLQLNGRCDQEWIAEPPKSIWSGGDSDPTKEMECPQTLHCMDTQSRFWFTCPFTSSSLPNRSGV